MKWSIFKREFMSSKAIHIALILFIVFSASLSVLSVITAVQTLSSIRTLYEVAQPPHFLQLHKGELNQNLIDDFMMRSKGVESWQTVHMINVYGENLSILQKDQSFDLSDCLLGISLVKQNSEKDLLLDKSHQKVTLAHGEVGIPILLKEMYDIQIGDQLVLKNGDSQDTYRVKTYILDAQMNSPMVSSTRILMSDEDFEDVSNRVGEPEYIIEAYFYDKADATPFQTLYENAGLPQNGQAVTYQIIFILSALTDMVTVFVMILVSALLILVSFVCVKYTMMAALEEDIGEIGTMKAIGFNFKDIRGQYLTKYRILAVIGVSIGTTLAMLMSRSLNGHIQMTFGEIKFSWMTMALSLIASFCVYGLVLFYCRRVLKKIKNVSVYDALVSGKGFEKKAKASRDGLHRWKKWHVNWLMSLREVRYRFKDWMVVFIIVWLIGFMIIVPINLTHTFKAPSFITYMGSSLEDIYIEIESSERLLENRDKVADFLAKEASIVNYFELKSVNVKAASKEGQLYNLHIDSGHAAGVGLRYLSGLAPAGENEIAISFLNAQLLEKEAGDSIDLTFNNEIVAFNISGVYQDVTSGGYTSKSQFDFEGVKADKFAYLVNVETPSESKTIATEWSKILNQGISIQPMDAFINQTLGGVVNQLQLIVIIIALLGMGIAGLITVLFLKLRLAKDASQIAILNAIGFSVRDIRHQYMIKIGAITLAGVLMGLVTTQVFANTVINFALSFAGLGIKRVDLVPNLWIQYFVCPVMLLMIILAVAWATLENIKKYHIMSLIKE